MALCREKTNPLLSNAIILQNEIESKQNMGYLSRPTTLPIPYYPVDSLSRRNHVAPCPIYGLLFGATSVHSGVAPGIGTCEAWVSREARRVANEAYFTS